jgi:argininosuccinate lyase
VKLPEAFSTGSSAMPQKKNPDLTELLRAKVGRIHGASQAVTLQLKGLPLAYNKDMQETQEPAFAGGFCCADAEAGGTFYRSTYSSIASA